MLETDAQLTEKSGVQVSRSSQIEYLKDSLSKATTVNTTSKTLETLLGEALPADVMAVTLVVFDEEIRYNPTGTAGATNSLLPAVYTLWGIKTVLDTAEFYSATAVPMGVIVHVPA